MNCRDVKFTQVKTFLFHIINQFMSELLDVRYPIHSASASEDWFDI